MKKNEHKSQPKQASTPKNSESWVGLQKVAVHRSKQSQAAALFFLFNGIMPLAFAEAGKKSSDFPQDQEDFEVEGDDDQMRGLVDQLQRDYKRLRQKHHICHDKSHDKTDGSCHQPLQKTGMDSPLNVYSKSHSVEKLCKFPDKPR